ncbi:hypothetical protein TNCV_1360231 [Trichonephila clavipes]|nr:hypothetical protein TNCV_1360231 [Trichonephila clavipes]
MGASSHSWHSLNKIMIRIISTDKCYYRLHYTKNWRFQTICQLATCEDRGPCIGGGLPPCTTITHTVKRRQFIEPVCVIVSHTHLFVSGYYLFVYLTAHIAYVMYCLLLRVVRGVYIWVGAQGLKKFKDIPVYEGDMMLDSGDFERRKLNGFSQSLAYKEGWRL